MKFTSSRMRRQVPRLATKLELRTPPIRPGTPLTTDDFGEDVASRSADAESRAVAGAWLNPVAGHDFAVTHKVGEDSFADRRLGLVFAYLLHCAKTGRTPKLAEAVEVGRMFKIPIYPGWLWEHVLRLDLKARELEVYIEAVGFFSRWREEIRRCLRSLIASLPSNYEVSVRPIKTTSSRTHDKKKKGACHSAAA